MNNGSSHSTASDTAASRQQAAAGNGGKRRRRLIWIAAVLLVVILLGTLLAPWWGRPVLKNAIKSALLAEGWQTVELNVTSLGMSQAKLGGIVLDRPEAQLEIPEVSLTYSLSDLLFSRRVQSVIVNRAKMEARFADQPLTLVAAPLLADWPRSDRLPFDRIYISEANIIPARSSGLESVQFNAMLEHTPPQGRSGGTARLLASAQSLWPHAHLEVSATADLRAQSLKVTLDAEFGDLNQWRQLPLPPEAHAVLGVVREKLTLQGAASVSQRTLNNWMLFGKTPAAVYTAPDGTHAEAMGVDFGVNVLGADSLSYAWLRSASGAAQNSDGSIEWNNLWAELKPREFLNAHIDSASLRAELSSVARELMPATRISTELSNLWRKQAWQASNLSLNLFSPDAGKNRPAFMRLSGDLKLGPFEYPWEKFFQFTPQTQQELQQYPLLGSLMSESEPANQPQTLPQQQQQSLQIQVPQQ